VNFLFALVPFVALALIDGVTARLGFAIAADVDPDVLIIDEALAVGEVAYDRRQTARFFKYTGQCL